jgi:exonuclease VII large subunit
MCLSIVGPALDRFVEARALEALAPASLDLALEAAGNVAEERRRLDRNWKQRLERAQYEADRAARRYHCVEPENRLVARQVESEWEAQLAEQRQLEEQYRRFERDHPSGLTDLEREAIRRLSADIPAKGVYAHLRLPS